MKKKDVTKKDGKRKERRTAARPAVNNLVLLK
jgi:hypothetical protein